MELLLLLLFFTSFSHQCHSAYMSLILQPHKNNSSTDLESLLAFKAGVADPNHILATNWTTDDASSFCSWVGVRCSSSNKQRVVALKLANFSLQGTISPNLANLSFLAYLNLRNNSLVGSLPHAITKLPRLAILYLEYNYLSGPIPPSIFNMSSLVELALSVNNFSGSLLPTSNHHDQYFMQLPRLRIVSLAKNNLTGTIPSQFGRCSNLQRMSFAYNGFSGSIPPEIGNLTELNLLLLGENQLTGTIPASSIGNLTKLSRLSLGSNHLEGSIPEELGNLQALQYLQISANRLTGSIPAALSNASNLNFLELGQNSLTGNIPTTLGRSWPQLTVLNLLGNRLSGGLDFIASLTNCRYLVEFGAPGNRLQGVLPDSIANLSTSLQLIDFSYNHIRGNIPAGFGNLSGLYGLNLAENELTGPIPSDLSRLGIGLQGLSLRRNRLSGPIPSDIGLLTSLSILQLSDNTFSGTIPSSLGNIRGLHTLTLDANRLSSSIPDSLWRLVDLIELDLSGNALDGSLLQVGNLQSLDRLDVSSNRFTGNISTGLGDLKMLSHLDLSSNSFSGQIPSSVKGLLSIKYMNLSRNLLSGAIPKLLANLSHLDDLDLSFNKLQGQIPQGGVFSNLDIQSLEGNAALCAGSLGPIGFPTCPTSNVAENSPSKKKAHLLKYILPPIAFILLSLFLLLFLFRLRRRRRRNQSKLASVVTSDLDDFRVISYHELVRATDKFNEANILGRGSSSSVFKACLDDGLIAAVKVMNSQVHGAATGSFDAECRALSTVRHRNLLKIITTCSNLEFKALVLEYMPNGSLDKWLYSPTHYLNLLERVNIVVDVSLALEYLHHYHPHVVVHRDLKPGNVLLDEDMVAHVGDFGIAKLLLDDSKPIILSANVSGTIGYMAPEYGSAGKVSSKGDVYSFGILLLETFTRKRPSDAMFVGELSLREWASGAYPDSVLEIVDSNLLTREEDAGAGEQQQQTQVLSSFAHRCLQSVIELGLSCSRYSPEERLAMSDVVPMLQKIRMEYSSNLPGP